MPVLKGQLLLISSQLCPMQKGGPSMANTEDVSGKARNLHFCMKSLRFLKGLCGPSGRAELAATCKQPQRAVLSAFRNNSFSFRSTPAPSCSP